MLRFLSVGFKQNFLMRTLFLLFICLFWGKTILAETLQTRNFIVNITRNCPEGEVVCNNVSYTGTSLKTAESIKLTGRTVYRLCSDRVTPCQFLGYEFINGNYRYFVTESGIIRIYKNGRLLLEESGSWQD
ncbi:MAG: hypothetical protein IM504_19315 [Microcystis sp. M038S2]|uniref:hypothetical protein n=1 Tax=unclassified Microcystis TaxID=2643300 RepID=UPI00258E0939|nr:MULTISPECIES: hypothetical protein [unclassified Microcystis]MCA2948969.1 hypothetical protein [Microcystis sp. M109S1]MCA2951539.1 hypothetical protein [Microcystis sp. M112S1]NCR22733.1 hypothetical protein [Microcystis aeruginosa L111-01]MCA2682910.1 hypothetical protein [Microcystis sp. M046S2]MCA2706892.1 hypothetical protein [Microcystis sp. M038S2]